MDMAQGLFEPDELLEVVSLTYRRRDYDILIPFICHQCTRCCQEIGYPREIGIEQVIAQRLGISYEDFVRIYIGDIADGQIVNPKPRAPCLFLSKSKTCTIYDVRPNGCRLYPLHTDFGRCGIHCPGWDEFQRVKNALLRGITCWAMVPYKYKRAQSLKRPSSDVWTRLYAKFLKGRPSSKMKTRFDEVNEIPTEIKLQN